ncbi:PREDICTED: uncharacterized protein LOC109149236 [Ipomoea nil]|uniref:uncharacterized protein LOC109149236 n=1 Tax=Ipomoea nil TaxID=35883 RepID=UPI0009011688|nr:PREDICTED: uncharacterized protein LOC109149236 [Ipomoea nil]
MEVAMALVAVDGVASCRQRERDGDDAVSWVRDIAPSHYVLRIESFSNLTKMMSEGDAKFFKSKPFEASGYKWIFSMYPNGVGDSKGHISVFLCIKDTDALPLGWKIYADLKFFIFDKKHDKYSVFQEGGINTFHCLKPECGISKLVPRAVFDDTANGYLVDGMCVFGVEVFVLHSKFVEQHLCPSVKVSKTYTWKVSSFSNMDSKSCYSDKFTAASFQWKLRLDPQGQNSNKSNGLSLSLFLELVDPGITSNGLFVHFILRIINQKSGKHREMQYCCCFASGSLTWGWDAFMPLADLQDLSNGFLVDDCIMIGACIKNVSALL